MSLRSKNIAAALFVFSLSACAPPVVQTPAPTPSTAVTSADLDRYFSDYDREYQRLYYNSALAEWESNTRIIPGDSTNARRTKAANEALARFVGSVENINRIRAFLAQRDRLTTLQV